VKRDEEEGFGIQLAPLVDIVFLLLIFFLLATTFLDEEKDLSLALPRTSAGSESGPRLDRVLVNVRSDGTVLLGDREVGRDELYRELVRARRRNPRVPVILRGDRAASHGDIVGVYSVCQRARIRTVAVAVEHARESQGGGEEATALTAQPATQDTEGTEEAGR
jgi:biopolymer transport protein ExbD